MIIRKTLDNLMKQATEKVIMRKQNWENKLSYLFHVTFFYFDIMETKLSHLFHDNYVIILILWK